MKHQATRLFALLLSLLCAFSALSLSAFCESPDPEGNGGEFVILNSKDYYEFNEDDKVPSGRVTSRVDKAYVDADGCTVFTASLTATFDFDGKSSATCTNAYVTYSIKNSSWSYVDHYAVMKGNTASGTLKTKRTLLGIVVKHMTTTMQITCDGCGRITKS